MTSFFRSASTEKDEFKATADVPRTLSTGSAAKRIYESSSRIQIDVIDLCFQVATVGKIKIVLKDVALQVRSGEMCAIMGPTSSGKSTLLDLVANRTNFGLWSGEILINKRQRPDWYVDIVAYVSKEDLLLPTLTVRETLLYAAYIRMEGETTLEEREKRVDYYIELFGMKEVRDTLVGDPALSGAPAISVANRKKLAIAQEMIAHPRLLFMDEPTSFLDRTLSMETMTAVRKLIDPSRVCMATIHHPSSELFALFDRLILLSGGRVIYSGPIDKVVTYFESIGFPYVSSQIAGDYIIQICGDKHKSPGEFQALFQASKYYSRSVDSQDGHMNPLLDDRAKRSRDDASSAGINELTNVHRPAKPSLAKQAAMLLHRGTLHNVRDYPTLLEEILKNIFFGFLIGMTFRNNAKLSSPYLFADSGTEYVDTPTTDVVNFTGLLYFVFMYMWFNHTLFIQDLAVWNHMYRREINAGVYSSLPYWLSSFCMKLPVRIISFSFFVIILYPLVGFPRDAHYFFFVYGVLFLTGVMSYIASQTCIVWFYEPQIVFSIMPHLFMCFGLFSGYPVLVNNVPSGWHWGTYVSFLRWSFESLMDNQFGDTTTLYVNDDDGDGNAALIGFYGFGDYDKNFTFLILFLSVVLLSLVTYYGMLKNTSALFRIQMLEDKTSSSGGSSRGPSEIGSNPTRSSGQVESMQLEYDPEVPSSTSNSFGGSHVSSVSSGTKGGGGGGYTHKSDRNSTNSNRLSGRYSEDHSYRKSGASGGAGSHYGSAAVLALRQSVSRISVGRFGGTTDITVEGPDRFFALDMEDFRASNIGAENTRGIRIDIVNLSYNFITPDGKSIDVLSGVSGTIKSGKMCAIMGGPDSGKQSLFDVLAGRRTTGSMSGSVLFNTFARNDDIVRTTAYITQADIHLPMLTVQETLYFAAELRMDPDETKLNKSVRVSKILEMMNLQDQKDTRVGTMMTRGLNGGQRRRLSMGVEMINFPCLVFLDEPTAGLDSVTADEVIAAMHCLAQQNRTVVCTLGHATKKAFESFNQLILMSRGQVIYFGSTRDSVPFFTNSPFGFNFQSVSPAEFMLAISDNCILSNAGVFIETVVLVRYYKSQQPESGNLEEKSFCSDRVSSLTASTAMVELNELPVVTNQAGMWKQIITLFHRYGLRTRRNTQPLLISFIRCFIVAIVLGTLFTKKQSGVAFNAYKNRFTFCFMSTFFNSIIQLQSIAIYFEDLLQFNKEKETKLFHPLSFWISTWLWHMIINVLHTLLFTTLAYSITGFCVNAKEYVVYYIIMYLVSTNGLFVAQIFANLSNVRVAAIKKYTLFILMSALYAGYFQYLPHLEPWCKGWVPYLSFMRWGYQALIINELNNDDKLTNSQYYLDQLQFNEVSLASSIGILFGFACFYFMVLVAVVWYKHMEEVSSSVAKKKVNWRQQEGI